MIFLTYTKQRIRGMTRRYFGTDGIRGQVNSGHMTADIALRLSIAAGTIFRRGAHRHRVVIGKDTRLSGYMLESALVSGFTASGMDVFQFGPIPTPAVAFLTRSLRADLGVMLTASHNQFEDNGIKLFGPDGYKLSDAQEQEIEHRLDTDLHDSLALPDQIGRAKRIDDAQARYIEFAKRTFSRSLTLDGVRVVIDCANGAAYKVAPSALWELGADVISIGISPTGFNINQGCGSTDTRLLAAKVCEVGADIGIALDGDADRVVICDEVGNQVDGDQLLALIAGDWHAHSRLTVPRVVGTQMSNLGLERHLLTLGLTLDRTQIGDRYVVERMRAEGINFGGEPSGHIVMSDFSTTGDGFIAALQVLSILKRSDKPVSKLCQCFELVPQVLRNIRFSGSTPLELTAVQAAIGAAEAALHPHARSNKKAEKSSATPASRLLVRQSGTEPVIRIMGEGDDRGHIEKLVSDICDAITSHHPSAQSQ